MSGGAGRLLDGLCRVAALAGGAVLLGMALLTGAGILGRALFGAPLAGAFELVETGTAVAVFLFLPLAQWRRAHARVDVLARALPAGFKRGVQVLSDLLLSGIAGILAWRLSLGGLEMARSGETTMVLEMPRWWAFPPLVMAAGLLAAVALYSALRGERDGGGT